LAAPATILQVSRGTVSSLITPPIAQGAITSASISKIASLSTGIAPNSSAARSARAASRSATISRAPSWARSRATL
jgi:hypothetical protein